MTVLKAKKRSILGKATRGLRNKNLIPAVIYGHGFESQNIEVDRTLFEKIFRQVGHNTIIDLTIDEKTPLKVLIHDVQYDPLKGEIIHADFYRIKEKEKVTVEVDLKFIGEAPVVKEKGGILVHNLTKIKIEALPKDLIHEVEIDISNLKDFHDLIRVKDIKISPVVKILQDPEEVIVSVAMPKKEEEAAPALAAEATAVSTEAVAEEKKEEEITVAPKVEKKPEEKKS